MSRRPYIGPSDAQANAEALARRGTPYTVESQVSFTYAWDPNRRIPQDLREAVRMVRRAYADEVPVKLHDGPDAIGPDGTPRMTPRATGYIFGSALADDRADADQLVAYYHAPFRACVARMMSSDESQRKRAAIVSHVTIGSQGPKEAAIAEGVPSWCAKLVAEDALRSFLRSLTDLKLTLPKETEAA